NIVEAEKLFGLNLENLCEEEFRRYIEEYPLTGILLKGGHSSGNIVKDTFITCDNTYTYQRERVNRQIRGTGCALSSALAVFSAKQKNMEKIFLHTEKFMDKLIYESDY
ncbi:hypothetical protein DRQ33_05280, partial [bacterium]